MSEATKARPKAKKKKKASVPKAPPLPFRERGTVGIEEIAEWLGVSRTTIEKERSLGKFPAHDLSMGRRLLWNVATLVAWLEKPRKGA